MRHHAASIVLAASVVTSAFGQGSPDNSTSEAIARALRTGRYAEATRLIDKVLVAEPDRDCETSETCSGIGPT
jgi:hypothetical protein